MPASRVHSLSKRMAGAPEVCNVSPSAWKGVLRNVPRGEGVQDAFGKVAASHEVVTVARASRAHARGPVLVLVNLKYRGNVGTIVRAAVQANCFTGIYFVGLGNKNKNCKKDNEQGGAKEKTEHYHWEKNKNKGVKDADISYYSLHNAPLIDKRHFETVHDFLQYKQKKSSGMAMVGIDGGTTVFGAPLSLYSKEATAVLSGSTNFYLAMGAEDNGLPEAFLTRCSSLISIPCLSASINVSCAFSMVLAVMQLASEERDNARGRCEAGNVEGNNLWVPYISPGRRPAAAAATVAVVVVGYLLARKG